MGMFLGRRCRAAASRRARGRGRARQRARSRFTRQTHSPLSPLSLPAPPPRPLAGVGRRRFVPRAGPRGGRRRRRRRADVPPNLRPRHQAFPFPHRPLPGLPILHRVRQHELARWAPELDCPVIWVTWWDAFCFALWIGAELPTGSQWEFACRAGRDQERELFGIPWRNPETGELRYDALSWREANFDRCAPLGNVPAGMVGERTLPVRHHEFQPNSWGLFQMHGNVWEWTCDRMQDCSEQQAGAGEDSRHADAPRGLRGGSWSGLISVRCRSAHREEAIPGYRNHNVGFRVVVSS
jgi:formylglycine-generating enzyme required for sulfatase activity